MGTMRNNFAGASVIVILMLSTSRSLPLDGNENSAKRNSLLDPRTTSPSVYECLFVDPDLPFCDIQWMLDSTEDVTSKEFYYGDLQRSRRNVDTSTSNVVVYTIEGCIPLRLPFSMPYCEGIPLDRIVDIQKFRPFAVKGVTKPPFIFPKWHYPQWLQMIARLRKHVSLRARQDAQHASTVEKIPSEDLIHGRADELIKAGTKKEIMRRTMITESDIGSSRSKLFPNSFLKSVESQSQESSDRSSLNTYTEQNENVENPPAIPAISIGRDVHRYTTSPALSIEPMMDNNFSKSSRDGSDTPAVKTDNGIENDFPPLEESLGIFRRRREISLMVPSQRLSQDSKADGIAGKSSNQRFSNVRSNANSKSKIFNGMSPKGTSDGIAGNADLRMIAIPRNSISVDMDFPGETDTLADARKTWRESVPKETTTRKKHGNQVEFQSWSH